MNLFDVHAHLDLVPEKEIQELISRAEQKNVRTIITNSTSSETGKKSLELQEKHRTVRAALGIYPANAAGLSEKQLQEEISFIEKNRKKIIAIGEIGLDYQETEDRKNQQRAFELQLDLAEILGLPVSVHSRKAEKETVETLIRKKQPKAIMHAFHGNMKLVKKAADAGISFSIPANIQRSHHFAKIAEILPLENIYTETDTPYLGPEKDGQSEPAHTEKTVKKIAEIKKTDPETVSEQIYRNCRETFG